MRLLRHLQAPLVAVVALAAAAAPAPRAMGEVPAAAGFVVIANAANPATTIAKLDVVRIFMKKTRAWPGGGLAADPVDQRDASAVRKEFLAAVVGKDAAAMNAYWQSQLFVGRTTPPPVKASDADVIAYVAASRGAIGFVSAGAALPETVKVIKVGE